MKLIKFLFNRALIISLLLLLQIVLLCIFINVFNTYFGYIYILLGILSGLLILYVLNRDQEPDIKMPWIFVIVAIAPLGGVIYLLFGNNKPSKRHKKLYYKIYSNSRKYNLSNKTLEIKLKEENPLALGQSNYISKSSYLRPYQNTQTKYFENGEAFFDELLKRLKKAKKFIFMEYFIIEQGKMWNSILEILIQKANSGIDVRVIYDDIGSIYKLPFNYDKKLRKHNIACIKFNKFSPIISSIHNNRDHRKITVIDGEVAFTGGINLADEYINEKVLYGHWKDSAIMLKGEAVKNFTLLFLQNYNAQTGLIEDYDKFMLCSKKAKTDGYVQPFGDGPTPLYVDRVGENVYMNIINQAKDYVYITTPYLITDFNFLQCLKLASKRGVDVRIITPHIPDKKIVFLQTQSNYSKLIKAGVKIYEYEPGFIHCKNAVSDNTTALISTINLDYRSFVHHFECGVWLYNTKSVFAIKEDFLKTLKNCIEIDRSFKFSWFKKFISDLISIFSPLM